MRWIKRSLTWTFTILIAVLIQVSFVFVDSKSSPTKTVIEFSKAYFLFDPVMRNHLCQDFSKKKDIENFTNKYLQTVYQRASDLGFKVNSTRQSLFKIKTKTLCQKSDFAKVRMEALSKTYINPLFSWVALIFDMGNVYHIDEIFELSKKNGVWKISNNPFEFY